MNAPKAIGYCALITLISLYIVGAVSNGVLRHIVQTLPLWFPIVLGLRRRELAKYAALPCFVIWLALMILIWLFLLGWARLLSGRFTPVEIILTLVIGASCIAGLRIGFRWRTSLSWSKASSTAAIFAILQVAALRISFLPSIAKDRQAQVTRALPAAPPESPPPSPASPPQPRSPGSRPLPPPAPSLPPPAPA